MRLPSAYLGHKTQAGSIIMWIIFSLSKLVTAISSDIIQITHLIAMQDVVLA